jgi:hypothetical protein
VFSCSRPVDDHIVLDPSLDRMAADYLMAVEV